MTSSETSPASPTPSTVIRGDILAIGLGTTVAMWFAGYLCRLPGVMAPNTLLFALLFAIQLAGGFTSGRYTTRGWLGGLKSGTLCGIVNLLIVGSILSREGSNEIHPGAAAWTPGFIAASAAIGALGGWIGSRNPRPVRDEIGYSATQFWTCALAGVASAATFLMIILGGLVTSKGAGLAVPDWPRSYGYNMFLYPLSRMTGGIYFEHTHRLFGTLVGLTTIFLAVQLQRVETRGWMKKLGWGALVFVCVQGVLGGLRVTGKITNSTEAADMAPSLELAVIHGVGGQLFFGIVLAIALFGARRWVAGAPPEYLGPAPLDRRLATALTSAIVLQLFLGALQRHFAWGIYFHVAMACVVLILCYALGIRLAALHKSRPPLPVLGKALLGLVTWQFMIGFAALAAKGVGPRTEDAPAIRVLLTTGHQASGALLLGAIFAATLWIRRIIAADAAGARASSPPPDAGAGASVSPAPAKSISHA